MKNKTHNPAAFPLKHSEDKFNPGMTLRDYFAGQVLTGILLDHEAWSIGTISNDIAIRAYQIAEAMLKRRKEYESEDNG
jgi:hypothetical protein